MIKEIAASLGYRIAKRYSSQIYLAYLDHCPAILRVEENDELGNLSLRKEMEVIRRARGIVGIPAFFAFHQREGLLMLAREYIPGKSFYELRKQRGRRKLLDLQGRQQGRMLEQILHQAHDRGIANYDISDTNIIVAKDGRPYLVDWDVAVLERKVSPEYFHKACQEDFAILDDLCKEMGLKR